MSGFDRCTQEVTNIGDLETFQRFVRLCAGRSGQLLNFSALGADCGVSHTTARHWISVLKTGFIIHLLPSHHTNFSKRIVKSPKLYFLDTGLLCYLLGVRDPEEISLHAMRGAIFETFVVSEIYKAFAHLGETPPLFFWRDKTGHEVDLVIDTGRSLIPVEMKSGQTVDPSFFAGLRFFASLGLPASQNGVLVHGGDQLYSRQGILVRPWFQCV